MSSTERICRIVLYGPLGAGKATCVESFRHLVKQTGKPRAERPGGARTTRLDFIAPGLPPVNGAPVRFVLSAASGGAFPYVDRDLLKHADGVLFVADSRGEASEANVASMAKLSENLGAHGRSIEALPVVLLLNKRDVGDAVSVDEMAAALNAGFAVPKPVFEACATQDVGVAGALDALARRILGLPEDIHWESTGFLDIPFRASSSGKRLYVKQGEPPRSPRYTLFVDGESTETHDEWPWNWVLPRIRIGDSPAPRPPPAASAPPAPAVETPAPPPPAPAVEAPAPPPAPLPPEPDDPASFEAAIAARPKDLELYRKLHRFYLRQDRIDEAWCVATVIAELASPGKYGEERAFAEKYVTRTLPARKTTGDLDRCSWEPAAPAFGEASPLERIFEVIVAAAPEKWEHTIGVQQPSPQRLHLQLLAAMSLAGATGPSSAFATLAAKHAETLRPRLTEASLGALRAAVRAWLADGAKVNVNAWLVSTPYFRLRRRLGFVATPLTLGALEERRVFALFGDVRFACGRPAGVVLIAAVAEGPTPVLLGMGIAYDKFNVLFTREAFDTPKVHLVISILDRAEDDFLVVCRHDVDPSVLLGNGKLGTIVLPIRQGDRPSPPPGLVRAPGGDRAAKRLRLDDHIVQDARFMAEESVREITGWGPLSDGYRFEIVDDFVAPLRRRAEALLGRTTFDEREVELLELAGSSLQAYGLCDPIHSVVYLNRAELEQQNLGFLCLTIGHELVHVGQFKYHPELGAEWNRLSARIWSQYLAGKRAPDVDAQTFGLMANLEGYADYIERRHLALFFTCSMQLERQDVKVPAQAAPRRVHTEIEAMEEPSAPPSLRTVLMSQKWAQYDSGRRAYVKRAKPGVAAKFDPSLRPDPVLPKEILQPLMDRALGGCARSQMALGDIYRTGGMVGVAADRPKAIRWYRLAAAGGSAEAATRLAELGAQA